MSKVKKAMKNDSNTPEIADPPPPQTIFSPEPVKIVKGLDGIFVDETAISNVDGAASMVYYRGIPVPELSKDSTFEETIYLLWEGRLPFQSELAAFKKELAAARGLNRELSAVLETFPENAHPMSVLRSMVSATGLFDLTAEKIDSESSRKKALRLTALFPTIIAAFCRMREGKKPVAPDKKLSHAANFLYMMHGTKPSGEMERALDVTLILLADHGFNASTFAARVTASTEADMYSAITSAIGTLKGDLHGSANQRAMEMILEVGDPEKAEDYVKSRLAQRQKIAGFGHRIYKKEDPRATAFREIANQMCSKSGHNKWIEICNRIEKVMWEEKRIPCNVDFFSASVLYVLGFPVDFFTTVFAASRVAGWTAHVIEQHANNRLIRPEVVYNGPRDQHYLPVSKRK